MTVCALIFIIIYFYESPKFLYSKGRYNEARYSIRKIAEFNGVNKKDDFEFIFDTEVRNNDPLNVSREYSDIQNPTAANE